MEIGKVTVMMTLGEYQKCKELIKRDKARPFIREKYETKSGYIGRCPVCGGAIGKGKFCSECGQRIDTDNMAF